MPRLAANWCSTDDPEANRFTLRGEFRCEELLKPTQEANADLFFVVPYSIPSCITGVSTGRKHPLAIRHPVNVHHTIRVNSDEPRRVDIPKQHVAGEFFHFSFVTSSTRTESVHAFTYQSKSGIVPSNRAQRYAEDLSRLADALNWHIRFRVPGRKHFRFGSASSAPESW